MPYLTLLGVAVLEDERAVVRGPAGRRHPVALLALLATAPARTLTRGKLVGLLWPDAPEKAARNRLNTCVHRLRKALGTDVLLSGGDGLRLDPEALGCDVIEFEEALEAGDHERAVELYGGPFLDGFGLGRSPPFEKWMDRERDRLGRDYRRALEALAERAEGAGEPEAAVRWWTRRSADDPYDSRVIRRRMEALEAAGNRAEALRVGEKHAERLREELGASPNAEVRTLVERLRGDPEPAERARAAPGPAPRRPAAEDVAGGAQTAGAAKGGADEQDAAAAEGASRDPGAEAGRARRRRLLAGILGAGALGAAALGLWHVVDASSSGADLSGPEAPAVAVLPFEFAGEGEGSTFAGAVHSDIVNRLAGLSDLEVISPSSARRMAEAGAAPSVLAAELGVDWIVRGEVQRSGDRVRVHARLVDARADRQVWGESYRARLTAEDLFDVQSEIARAIADVLEVRLSAEEGARLRAVPTRNTAAYELYLQGREILGSGTADEDRVDAQASLYRRAVELDSTFAAAWARLSIAFWARGLAADGDRAAWADSAWRAAERAVALDPELADAHVARAFAGAPAGRPESMVAGLRRAFELQPTNLMASHNLAVALLQQGRLAEALGVRERAHRLAPTERLHIVGIAGLNRLLGNDTFAEAWLAHARERGHATLRAEVGRELFYGGRLDRARVLIDSLARGEEGVATTRLRAALALRDGRWREARRLYGSLYPGHPYASSILFLGLLWDPLGLAWSLRELGEDEEAKAIAAEVIRKTESELEAEGQRAAVRSYLHHRLTVGHLLLGDTAAALDALEAVGSGNLFHLRKLETLPVLAPLRGHPRFRALLGHLRERVEEERRRAELEGWGEPPLRAGQAGSTGAPDTRRSSRSTTR